MSEQLEKLRATLQELVDELDAIDSLDPEATALLEKTTRKIQAALHEEDTELLGEPTLVESLKESVEQFEASYPTLTEIVSRMIDGLARMGI